MDAYEVAKQIGELLRNDRDRDRLAPLAHYQARFPGHEELIARDYAAVHGSDDGSGPSSLDWLPAREREHYSKLGEIARGGMGAILRVRDETLGRDLAMKVVLGEGGKIDNSGPGTHGPLARRFLEEAKITARLDHPGVVPVHELGADEDGTLFFTMKLIKGGRTLAQVFERAREEGPETSQNRVLQLFVRVLETLAFAHKKGIIHRDLKPANVMVGDFGEVYVMDWGLAKVAGSAHEEPAEEAPVGPSDSGAGLTEAGQILGTPAYMPVEQARNADLDARADLYAVGAMLYEYLAGIHPYGSREREPSGVEIVLRLMKEPPEALAEAAPDAPPELVSIVEKAMARDRADRYATAMELAADLRNFVEGRVVTAHEAGTWAELRKWIARNRSLSGAVAAAVLLLIAGLVAAVSLGVRADRERDAALHNAYRAEIEAAVAYLANRDLKAAGVRLERAPEDLRGWEWNHIASRIDESLLRMGGCGMALRPDGALRMIDAGGVVTEYRIAEGTSRVLATVPFGAAEGWITKDGGWVFSFRERPDEKAVFDLRFVPIDGDGPERSLVLGIENRMIDPGFVMPRLGYSGHDRLFHVRDLETGEDRVPSCVADGAGMFARPTWEPDLFLLERGDDVLVVDIALDRVLLTLRYPRDRKPICAARNPARTVVAVGGEDGGVDFWDLTTGERIDRPPLAAVAGPVNFVIWDPPGRVLAAGGIDRAVRLFDVETGELIRSFQGHLRPLEEGQFTPDGAYLVTRDAALEARVWSVGSADPYVLRGHASYVYALAFSPDGARIYTGGWDGFVDRTGALRVWDVATGAPVAALGDGDSGLCVYSLAVTSDGRRVVTVGGEKPHFLGGPLHVWDTATGRLVRKIGTAYRTLALHPEGRLAVASEFDGDVAVGHGFHLVDLETGEVKKTFLPKPVEWASYNLDPTFSPDGRLLATPDEEGRGVILWDPAILREVRRVRLPDGQITSIRFSPDGTRLLTSADDDSWRVWDVATAREIGAQTATGNEVLTAVYTTKGRRILTGGRDRNLRLWDAETLEEIVRLPGHDKYIKSVAASPDDRMFATASGDGTVRLWQTRTAKEIHAAQVRRRGLVAEHGPRVKRLFDELGDADGVVRRIEAELAGRAREVALQLALAEAVARGEDE